MSPIDMAYLPLQRLNGALILALRLCWSAFSTTSFRWKYRFCRRWS